MNHEVKKGKKLAEGKTKIIWQCPNHRHEVLMESKDDITAGDGARRHVLPGKGTLATTTTCNVFELLERQRVPTHYIGQLSPEIFRARAMAMIPIELVARRIATGSYLKRHPEVAEGTRFPEVIVECFLKDDARHDPLMMLSDDGSDWELYDAKKSRGGLIDLIATEDLTVAGNQVGRLVHHQMLELTKKVFLILETAWAQQDVTLVDLKIECGFDAATGELRVADVIDNDSWRIWPKGQKALDVSKQVYRDLPEVTDATLKPIRDKYAWVAHASEQFFS